MLGFALALTILVNLFMIQRRFEPLERLIETMEKADLARSGMDLNGIVDGGSDTEEVERLEAAFRRMLERLDADAAERRAPRCRRWRRSAPASHAISTTRSTSR